MGRWIDFIKHHYGKITFIVFCISGLTAYLGGFEKVITYIDNYQETRELPFQADEYGVLVCYFDGEDEYKKYASKDIVNTLNARFRELNMRKAQAKHDAYVFVKESITSHGDANEIGKKYNADLVIWGSVSKKGIQPNIRFVDNSDAFRSYTSKEMTIFKESLNNVASDKSNRNISYAGRKPALTDEPVSLISFVIAKRYMDEQNFSKAIEYFRKAIPLEKTPYIRNEPTYIQITMCYYSVGDFQRAEETILKQTNYRRNDNLLALVGIIRHMRSSFPEHAHKKLAELWLNASPKDWEFLDQLYLYAITEKQLTPPTPRKKDPVDTLIEERIKNPKRKHRSWSFLEIARAQENKDYARFKQLHAELFETSNLNDQLILALLSISVDLELASESIQKIRSVHGVFPGLSLMDAFKCLAARDIEAAKLLIEKHSVLKEKSLIGRTILATYYSMKAEYMKSLAFLDELIIENPKATFYRKLRADINYYLQKPSSAKIDYELYIADHPDDTKVLYRLALLSSSEKENADALEYIQKLFAQPVKENLHFAELLNSVLLNKPISTLNTFLDTEHEAGIQAFFKLLNKNDVDAAKAKLTELINNEHPATLEGKYVSFYYYVYAVISLLENHFFECQSHLLNAYAEYPTEELKLLITELSKTDLEHAYSDKLFFAGKDAFQKMLDGNFVASAEFYEMTAKEYPKICYLWNRAGIYRLLAKDTDRALVDYSIALQCEPEAKGIHSLYADLVKEKDCNLAVRHYSRSLEIDGDSIGTFDGLSQCHTKLGNTALADEFYQKYKTLYFEKGVNPVNFFFYQPLRQL